VFVARGKSKKVDIRTKIPEKPVIRTTTG